MIEDTKSGEEDPARADDGDVVNIDGAERPGAEDVVAATSPDDRIRELECENADLADRVLRAQAELINFRRRTDRNRVEQIARARADLLRELLPVVDNFERAVVASVEESPEAYREGVEIILRSLLDTLGRMGAERIEPEGAPFDPEICEAVETVSGADVPPGHVAEVYQAGYRFQDLLLRPARVAVATAADDEPTDGD